MTIEQGQQAPDFELASDSGERVRLSDLRGRPVVLYFYPRDDASPKHSQYAAHQLQAHGPAVSLDSPRRARPET